jgi:hypothetical protein
MQIAEPVWVVHGGAERSGGLRSRTRAKAISPAATGAAPVGAPVGSPGFGAMAGSLRFEPFSERPTAGITVLKDFPSAGALHRKLEIVIPGEAVLPGIHESQVLRCPSW